MLCAGWESNADALVSIPPNGILYLNYARLINRKNQTGNRQ